MRNDIKNIVEYAVTSEKAIEAYLVKRVEKAGCLCLKYSNPNAIGYPDRVVVEPNGIVQWVELKSKGQHPSPIQLIRINELRELGHDVFVIDSKKGVDAFIRQL